MKVEFERSGGFAGLTMTHSVDTDDLSSDQAQQLAKLMDDADFYNLPKVIKAKSPGADRFQYNITVQDQKKRHSVQVGEGAIPANMKPLLDWLTDAARHK